MSSPALEKYWAHELGPLEPGMHSPVRKKRHTGPSPACPDEVLDPRLCAIDFGARYVLAEILAHEMGPTSSKPPILEPRMHSLTRSSEALYTFLTAELLREQKLFSARCRPRRRQTNLFTSTRKNVLYLMYACKLCKRILFETIQGVLGASMGTSFRTKFWTKKKFVES